MRSASGSVQRLRRFSEIIEGIAAKERTTNGTVMARIAVEFLSVMIRENLGY
jgi:hypothetical protein